MSKLIQLTVEEFVKETASDSPAPGGGSAAAFAGAEAAALGIMVINLTEGKKAFLKLDPELQKEFSSKRGILERLQENLLRLLDEDTEAFLKVMAAIKLPKDSEEEIKRRKKAMAEANMACASVPIATAQAIIEILEVLPFIAEHGNKNCISDIGSAALLADSGLGAAHFNVLINMPGVSDEAFVKNAREQVERQKDRGNELKDKVLARVYEVFASY